MNGTLKGILIVVLVILAIGLIIFGLSYAGLAYKKFFEPKSENINNEIWEATKSRTDSAIQDINNQMLEYNSAETDNEKMAICGYLRNSYPTFDANLINDYKVKTFFNKCKYVEDATIELNLTSNY